VSLCQAWYSTSTEKNVNAYDVESLEGVGGGFVLKLSHAQLEPVCFHVSDGGIARKWFHALEKNTSIL
jgi:hypothetical protein